MNKKLIIILSTVAALVIAALLFVIFRQKQDMTELVEQMEFEKEQLEEEYEDLAIQFDGYQGLDIRNDSLQDLLNREQQRVRDLLEELRITKVTNARRIAELKKELATVRAVMVTYVHQIDSLNATNERLTAENKQYRQQYAQATQEAEILAQEKSELTEVVSRAAMLEVVDFDYTTLNKRDRKTRVISQIEKVQIDYTLARNITCERGMKHVYLRIVDPKGELMTNGQSGTFAYEDGELEYSTYQEIEYTGEEMQGVIYWSFVHEPALGIYNADFFIDGNLIGSFPFTIKK